jgi:hypothetical protein
VEEWALRGRDPRERQTPPDHEDQSGRCLITGRRRRTLPPGGPGSTIRAAGFHFRVRDGIGWIPRAIATGHKGPGVGLGRRSRSRAPPRIQEPCMCAGSLLSMQLRWTGEVEPVKPHGPLVRLGCSAHAPCTCRLSTWWSPTALQGDQVPGKTHLWRGFPLRCIQRLSLPDVATRHCHWRDNRYTRGRSVPVLSY